MNQMKIPQLVTSFQMDKSFQQQIFIQNQSDLNQYIKKNHKNNNYHNKTEEIIAMSNNNLNDTPRVKFTESRIDSRIQGKMLDDQMRLKILQSEYDHQKTKIQDQHNARTFNKKYPYGKQNVKITEQVIDKYSMNTYLNQSQMLKKFQQDAKKHKQQHNNHHRSKQFSNWSTEKQPYIRPQSNNYNSARSANKRTSILTRQMNKLYETKKKYLSAEVQKAQGRQKLSKKKQSNHGEYNKSHQKENKKLDNIQQMLKQVRSKLDLNISTLNEKQTQRIKHINFQQWVQISRDRLQKLSQLSKQDEFYRRKVPVVIYNNQKNNEKNYFSRIVCPDIDNYERKQNIDKQEQFNQVINIYQLNKKRMDQLSSKIAVEENKSVF